ncbi:MAG: hypothetical protein H3C62_01055 [Gemmatimonadaceae bacterium]|nr:hypothetical protein [Gemmatimonadaceae bacterium]
MSRRISHHTCHAILALLLTLTARLDAQQARGPWVSAQNGILTLQPVSATGTLGASDHGPSQEWRVGWRGDSTLSAFVAVTRTTLPTSDPSFAGEARYREIAVGSRIQFPQYRFGRLQPVLDLAVVQRSYRADLSASGRTTFNATSMEMTGLGIAANAGVLVQVMRGVDLEGIVGATLGQFNRLTLSGTRQEFDPVQAGVARARIGLLLSPAAWWR